MSPDKLSGTTDSTWKNVVEKEGIKFFHQGLLVSERVEFKNFKSILKFS